MASALWAAIAIAVASCGVSLGAQYDPNTANPYVDAYDRQIARFASEAVTKYCGPDGFLGEVTATRDDLAQEVGGENIIVNALKTYGEHKESNGNQEDLAAIIQEEVLQPWVYFKIAPMFFAIFTILTWCCCCWSACIPACRCCKRDHKHSVPLKGCQAVVVAMCFAVAALATLATNAGFARLENGFDNLLCSGAKLLNVTLDGEGGTDGFIGVVPVLDKFHSIESQLDDGSPMMNDIGDIINSTKGIEDALRLTSDTLKLLGAVLSHPSNIRPRDSAGDSMYHICLTCETLGPLVTGIATGVEEGVGNALFKARAEIESQLSGPNREDLKQTLEQASGPMMNLKEQMSSALKSVVDPNSDVDKIKEQLVSGVYYSIFVVHLAALALICGGCCSCACFFTSKYDPEEAEAAPGVVPKNCSCVVWCCSFLFLFFVFLSSGLLNLLLIPSSGLCVMLADLDADLLQDVAAGLDLNLTGDHGTMFENMVDSCWSGESGTSDHLLDIIFERNSSGSKVYLRERMVDMITAPVDQAFAQIDQALQGNITIGSNPAFAQLSGALSNASISGTLMLEPPYYDFTNSTDYQPMGSDEDLVKAAFMTSTQCGAYEMAGMGRLNGISDFVSEMQARYGAVTAGTHGCIQTVANCVNSTDPVRTQACEAANNYIGLKKQLLTQPIYRCDQFSVGGVVCDPLSMTRTPNGTYINDCLQRHSDGYTYTRMINVSCTLPEFDQYVKDFGVRLGMAIDRLDNVTLSVLSAISTDMKGLVDTYFMSEIIPIVSGLTCGFMPPIVKQVIDGMCFQGVAGLKVTANMYQITALIIVILALDMYVLFRIIADNIAKFHHKKNEAEAQV